MVKCRVVIDGKGLVGLGGIGRVIGGVVVYFIFMKRRIRG
jgi:hypothetical protein